MTLQQLLRDLHLLCGIAGRNPTPGTEALYSYAARMGQQRAAVNAALGVEDFRALIVNPDDLRGRISAALVLAELEAA